MVEPDFVHESVFQQASLNAVYSSLTLTFPPLTLAPGDLLRVTVEFTNGKYLRLGPTPPDGYQAFSAELNLEQSIFPSSSSNGNGATETVRLFDAQRQPFLESTERSSYWASLARQELTRANVFIDRAIVPGEDTSLTFRKWLFELEVPTTISTSSGSFSYHTTTFVGSYVHLNFNINQFADVPLSGVAVYVVPEPTMLWLGFALAATLVRRSGR